MNFLVIIRRAMTDGSRTTYQEIAGFKAIGAACVGAAVKKAMASRECEPRDVISVFTEDRKLHVGVRTVDPKNAKEQGELALRLEYASKQVESRN